MQALPMTDYEIYSYKSNKKHVHDEREVERIDLSYMDEKILNKSVAEKKQAKPKFSKLSEEQIYEMLNIKKEMRGLLSRLL